MKNSKLLFALRIVVSLSLLTLLLWLARENFSKIWELLKNVRMDYFSTALALYLFTIVLLAWRLQILLSVQGCDLSIRHIFSLNLIGYFFTNFMPTSIGGDLVKGFYIAQKNKSKTSSYATIFVDRVVGTLSLALIATGAIVTIRKEIEYAFIFWAVGFLLLASLAASVLLLNKGLSHALSRRFGMKNMLHFFKIDTLAKNAYEAMHVYAHYKKQVLLAFIISVVSHFLTFSSVHFLALSLNAKIPFMKILLGIPVISILCMLPVTMNGLGLREWAFVFFLRSNIGEPAALSISVLYLSMFLLVSVLGGIVYLLRRQ